MLMQHIKYKQDINMDIGVMMLFKIWKMINAWAYKPGIMQNAWNFQGFCEIPNYTVCL